MVADGVWSTTWHSMETLRFNLRVWFAVAAFAVIMLLTGAFAVLVNSLLTTAMLDREVTVTQEFLQSTLAAEGYDERMRAGEFDGSKGPLAGFAQQVQAMPEILRANLYGTDGRVLWSTDRALIGQRFEANPELDDALAGKVISEVSNLRSDAKPEHVALAAGSSGFFIEAYLPMRRGNTVIGVLELYKVPTALEEAISRGHRIIVLSAALGGLLLFATLYWIVHRGAQEIQRQQTVLNRMERLAAVGQMASAIAHSLRNPLAGVRSSAELLPLEHPEVRPVSDEIISEVDRLDVCVRELMDYARSDTPSVQQFDPLDVVHDTISRQRPALQRAGIEVIIEDERTARRQVAADPLMLGQAMTSIVTNAVEAQQDGGKLRIALSEPDSRRSRVTFSDKGPGIPNHLRTRVGEPFFTTKTRGLGLGLALARRIVERFGGSLEVEDSSEGAAIRIDLMYAQP